MGVTEFSSSTQTAFFHHSEMRPMKHHSKRRHSFDKRTERRPRRKPNPKFGPPSSAGPSSLVPKCTQCAAEQPKYKCPQCRVPYCSIECCRKHKEQNCVDASKQRETNGHDVNHATHQKTHKHHLENKSKYLPPSHQLGPSQPKQSNSNVDDKIDQNDSDGENLDAGWKITSEMKNTLVKSDWLQKELQDGGLRRLILEICSTSKCVNKTRDKLTHQEEMLETFTTKFPMFRIFLDKLKVLAGVLERQGQCSGQMEDLKHWLELDGDNIGPLALKPLSQHREASALPPLPVNDSSSEDSTELSSSSSDEASTSSSSEGSQSDSSSTTSS